MHTVIVTAWVIHEPDFTGPDPTATGNSDRPGEIIGVAFGSDDGLPLGLADLGDADVDGLATAALVTDWNSLTGTMIIRNLVVFGSVSANRHHFEAAAEALARADRGWLSRLITRRVPLDRWDEALERRPEDVKSIILV